MSNNKFYISDTHFWHHNILIFDNRPYQDCEEMAEDMKKRWNEHVPAGAHVYILGDFTWRFDNDIRKFLRSLNGTKHLIRGNHDKNESAQFKNIFAEIVPYKEIKDDVFGEQRKIIMSHYYMPFYNSHYYNGILLHGHSHVTKESVEERRMTAELKDKGYSLEIYNVGCMYPYMDYTPRTIEEVIEGYKKWIAQ